MGIEDVYHHMHGSDLFLIVVIFMSVYVYYMYVLCVCVCVYSRILVRPRAYVCTHACIPKYNLLRLYSVTFVFLRLTSIWY